MILTTKCEMHCRSLCKGLGTVLINQVILENRTSQIFLDWPTRKKFRTTLSLN